MKNIITIYSVAAMLLSSQLLTSSARCEFYNFIDKNGTTHFVDDISKIPTEYRKNKKVYHEEEDSLSKEERAKRYQQKQKELEQDAAHDAETHKKRQLLKEKEERENFARSLVTPVTITGNRVFVQVNLSSSSAQTTALMLIDTGASSTLITSSVADRLKLTGGSTAVGKGVGGRVMTKRSILSEARVGPTKRTNLQVSIINERGDTGYGDGLLGMDYLRGYKYHIDFEKQVLVWTP